MPCSRRLANQLPGNIEDNLHHSSTTGNEAGGNFDPWVLGGGDSVQETSRPLLVWIAEHVFSYITLEMVRAFFIKPVTKLHMF